MNNKFKVLSIFGTRPEAIKMMPLVRRLALHKEFDAKVCVTGQHRSMLDQVLKYFYAPPDFDLNIMSHAQGLSEITGSILTAMTDIYSSWRPDLILVHGDTATTLSAALSAFYEKIPVGHVEAGIRTGDIFSPWPEEANRKMVSVIASLHFAPTNIARDNLILEGNDPSTIYVTGNTVIDALLDSVEMIKNTQSIANSFDAKFNFLSPSRRMLLVTAHRRENFGSGFNDICLALKDLAIRNDLEIVFPVHLNPNVGLPVRDMLSNISNIHLIEPQEYLDFIYLMKRSHLVLTDSGGIQEEAPALGKPVMVMRETTERPEAIDAGTAMLVGADRRRIVDSVNALLDNPQFYADMSNAHSPYGDGAASEKIIEALLKFKN